MSKLVRTAENAHCKFGRNKVISSGMGHPKSTSEIELIDGRMTDEKDLWQKEMQRRNEDENTQQQVVLAACSNQSQEHKDETRVKSSILLRDKKRKVLNPKLLEPRSWPMQHSY